MAERQPSFDADAYLAALEPPVYVHGGREYVGRVLSHDEWLPLEAAIEGLADADERAVKRVIRRAADAMFPPPPARFFGWLRRRAPTVGELVARLPLAGQLRAFEGFASAQAGIQTGKAPGPTRDPETTPAPSDADGGASPASPPAS